MAQKFSPTILASSMAGVLEKKTHLVKEEAKADLTLRPMIYLSFPFPEPHISLWKKYGLHS
ncbi:hypothetical protein B1J94_15655 [Leptospira kirschneri serovar Grippotyphosa]|nr:hypothetical protein B1J94_15655 [Leptospira kirschneri serovar Grippotyphosa]